MRNPRCFSILIYSRYSGRNLELSSSSPLRRLRLCHLGNRLYGRSFLGESGDRPMDTREEYWPFLSGFILNRFNFDEMRRILSASSSSRLLQPHQTLVRDRINRFSRIKEFDQIWHNFLCREEYPACQPHEFPTSLFRIRNRIVR